LSINSGLSGLEWAVGVPGTVGGAIYGNAQAFGTKISNTVKSVEAVNTKTFAFKNLTGKQCQFSLKNSAFKKDKNLVIISAVLKLENGDAEQMQNKIKDFLEHRRTKHPMEFPSAGSVFINPEEKIKNKKLLEKFPELNEYNEKGIIPAGYLISRCGLAGKKIGGAQISEKHANFIINSGGAKAKDVLSLINLATKKVMSKFNVLLEPEVQFVGFDKK
jgi:UDP-N-acetylmuramate dehydrogenase